ncbi:hypothetical protein [Aliihoeflea sp. 40Bstr573]|uniref:hypothetical protein n=1 Tax=Aliihoeflea sp. 40Bstr573 TaxID=2696467 RepID=UPI002096416F|nr:hypothetical protein [Aliihoeflea sp. 40Bstr573]MCO6386337.1 hypothetical protein [Aliihoeflea sp. 40Bstr573]
MWDWFVNNTAAVTALVTALGMALFIPLFDFLGKFFHRHGPVPPPAAYDARDLPDHPLLVSAKVHLNEPELEMLRETAARTRRMERQLDRVIEKIDHVNDRLD